MGQFFASYGALIGTAIGGILLFFGNKYINRANATKVVTDTAVGLITPLNERITQLETAVLKAQKAAEDADARAEKAEHRADKANERAEKAEERAAHAVSEASRANERADESDTKLRKAVEVLTAHQIPIPW